jgi:hypothetical protein
MLDASILSLLEESLPHVEFRWDGEQTRIIQRDIYSGKIIEIEKESQKVAESAPLAMRTKDFGALFSLARSLRFMDCGDFFHVTDFHDIEAIVGGCLYDDLGKLNVLEAEYGGQKPKGNAG